MNAMNIAVVNEEDEDNYCETQNLSQNVYLLCLYHEFLEYIAVEDKERLDGGTILSLSMI